MDNRQLLEDIGIDLSKSRGNQIKTTCPKCSHTRKKKKDPCLSVNISEGTYNCHNCDWQGGVSSSSYHYEPNKSYTRPEFVNRTECSDNIVKWFATRGISQRVLSKAKITESKEWMPGMKPGKKGMAINFNYFREGELINIKFRNGNKKFKLSKNAELIFYGLDNIKDSETVIIVEGEIDKLSFDEANVEYSTSVPNGASLSENANLSYLDNCIEYFENKKTIILATDNDDPGIALRNELGRRLGYGRCFKVDFKDCKDANEYLLKYGPEALADTVKEENLIPFPISGIVDFKQDVLPDFWKIINEGGLGKGAEIGIPDIDSLITWERGQLTATTGIPNHGKSIIMLEIMLLLSIRHGWKWGIFSPEHFPLANFAIKIVEMLIGRKTNKSNIQKSEIDMATDFIQKHLFFIQPEDDNKKLDNILELAKSLVVRHGISGLLIDPWNKLEHEQAIGISETNLASNQLDRIIKFNQNHLVHSIIIAHPTKVQKQGTGESMKYRIPNLYDIAGSANWYNKIDNGIIFYRDKDEGINKFIVEKIKWENLGRPGESILRYNPNNARFIGVGKDDDNSNWLISNQSQGDVFSGISRSFQFDDLPPVDFTQSVRENEFEENPF